MKKAILIIIACACLALSCSSIPKRVRNAFTYCYTGTYTGIDTLININGYYSVVDSYNATSIMFYDNGLAAIGNVSYNMEQLDKNKPLFYKEVAENPETKEAKHFYNLIDCGSYVICGDTIKIQMIYGVRSIDDNLIGMERWYKIIDKDTLQFLDAFPVTTNKKDKEDWRRSVPVFSRGGKKITFIPVPVKPQLDYFWILREKWFWCNEQDWKNYMQRIK